MRPRLLTVTSLLSLAAIFFVVNHVLLTPDTTQAGQPRGRRGNAAANALIKPPQSKGEAEKKILAVLDEIKKDRARQYRNVSADDGRLMRMLAETAGAKRIVEIGMSTGYSALWLAMALQSTGGKLYTHEIDDGRIKMAREHFKKAGVEKLITIIPGDAHETVKQHKEPIDMLFLDADKQGYIDYLNKLLPVIRPGGMILAHNMVYPKPDPKFIEAITTNPNLDTMFLLMDGAGISVTLKKR